MRHEKDNRILKLLKANPKGLSQYKIGKTLGFYPTIRLHNLQTEGLVDLKIIDTGRVADTKLWFINKKESVE